MSAKAKSKKGTLLICRLVNARRIAKGLTYQALANLMRLKSNQHSFRLCNGSLPIQFYHLDSLSKALDWDFNNLALLWNVGRLIDERVPAEKLSLLLPCESPDAGAIEATPGSAPGTRSNRDGRLPGNQPGYGATADAHRIDVDLLVRLIQHGPTLFPETEVGSKEYQFRRLTEMVGKLLTILAIVFGLHTTSWSIPTSVSADNVYYRSRFRFPFQITPQLRFA